MKLAVAVLVMLGLLAAGAAVILAQAVFTDRQKEETIDVLLAQTDLPPRTRLTLENVRVAKVPELGLPKGYYTNPAQANGKILKLAVTEGQPITDALVLVRGGVADLLRPGMRALSAPVSKRTTGVGLLEPGSVVDVHVTFPLRNNSQGDAVVIGPLLQQIRVLAIDDRTIPSEGEVQTVGRRAASSTSGNVVVTLEVTDIQARALQLSLKEGTLALPLRNPTDDTFYPVEVTLLKEGRLVAASKDFDPRNPMIILSQYAEIAAGREVVADANTPADLEVADGDRNSTPPVALPPVPVPVLTEALKEGARSKTVELIRADKVEEVEVDTDSESAEDAGDDGG